MTCRFAADDFGCFRTSFENKEAAKRGGLLFGRILARTVSGAEAITVRADMFIFLVVAGPGAADQYGSGDNHDQTHTKKAAGSGIEFVIFESSQIIIVKQGSHSRFS